MPKYSSKIGDIYSVPLDSLNKKYFQYIANDMTMLNSSVIRAFKKFYPINEIPDLNNIVNDEIDFYAHVVIQWGVIANTWEKIGNVPYIEKLEVIFKDPQDFDNPEIEISEKWRIWKINEPMKFVGKLEGENQKAEIGMVLAAHRIVGRMRTGKYNMAYPGYDDNSIMTYIPDEEGERIHKLIEKAIEEKMKKIENRKGKKKD